MVKASGSFGKHARESPRTWSTNSERSDMARSSIVRELWGFMRVRKKFWLLPIIVVLVLVGALIVFAQGSVLAPFIYTIF
jgi:hypothetical protein